MTSLYISADHSTRQMTGFPMMGPDGTQYPGYGVTAELLESMGYAPVPERPRPDDRFYLVESSPKDDGSWVAVPKPLEQIKEQLLGQVKAAAGQLLAATDWMVIRKADTGAEIPPEVAAFRQLVREHSNTLEALITGAGDLQALEGVVIGGWPVLAATA